MEAKDLLAKSETTIHATAEEVWNALVTPAEIKKYMFGSTVESEWKEGSAIVWKGEWQGKKYEDKGKIIQIEPASLLQYSHFSPLSGKEDKAENYHTVTIRLSFNGDSTNIILTQDHNATKEEQSHSEQNWSTMLGSLKKVVEESSH